jgi:uncharacterized delta-60 repeat protein
MKIKNIFQNQGQSLVEVLVALAVGIIFVLGTMVAVQMSLKSGKDSEKIQVSASLARELMDNIKIFAESDWHNISNLATTSANHYYLNTTSTPFTAVSGEESITISTTTYNRYFYVDDVYRDGSGKISSSGNLDPSTKKITVVYKWLGGSDKFLITYLTRSKNIIFNQTDWSGGGGQTGPITSINEKFDTSQNINFSNKGSISLSNLGTVSGFVKTIGGTDDEEIYSLQQTSDGGYILGGSTNSFGAGSSDMFVVKLDSSGNISWSKTIGGTNSDGIYSLQQTSDGGYILGGWTNSFGAGSSDMFVVKLDSSGNISWSKTIGGTNSDGIYSLQQTSDGGYILGGWTTSFGAGGYDMFVVKLDSSGNISWSKTIGGTNGDVIFSLQQTSDGGYILGGWTTSFGAGGYDMFVVKLNSSGNISWSKTIGGTNGDGIYSLQQTSDGGYILGGWTNSFGAGSIDMFVVKLDSSGNISWSKTIGGTNIDYIHSLQQTSDGGYILGGYTTSFGAGSSDMFVVKLTSSGNIS